MKTGCAFILPFDKNPEMDIQNILQYIHNGTGMKYVALYTPQLSI